MWRSFDKKRYKFSKYNMSIIANNVSRPLQFNQHPQIQAWLKGAEAELNVAFSLRWTHECRTQRRLYDEASCSRDIGYFWNGVDRALYGDDWKQRKLKRLTVLENTDGANWHIHGLCSADGYSVDKMRLMLSELWLRHIKVAGSNRHTHKHLAWIEQSRGDYGNYILKHVGNTQQHGGCVGVIDVLNTYLG
jgi:hypothetical protein